MAEQAATLQFYNQHPMHHVVEAALRNVVSLTRVVMLANDFTTYSYMKDALEKSTGEECYDLRRDFDTPFAGRSLYYIAPSKYPMSLLFGPMREHVFNRQKTGERVRVVEVHTDENAAHLAADYWGCEKPLDMRYDAQPYRDYFARLDMDLRAAYDMLPRYAHHVQDYEEVMYADKFGKKNNTWKTPAGHKAYDEHPLMRLGEQDVLLYSDDFSNNYLTTDLPMWSKKAQAFSDKLAAQVQGMVTAREKFIPALVALQAELKAAHVYHDRRPEVTFSAGHVHFNFKRGSQPYNEDSVEVLRNHIARTKEWAKKSA